MNSSGNKLQRQKRSSWTLGDRKQEYMHLRKEGGRERRGHAPEREGEEAGEERETERDRERECSLMM